MAFDPTDGRNPQKGMRTWTGLHATAELYSEGLVRQGCHNGIISKEVPHDLCAPDEAIHDPKTGSEDHDNDCGAGEFRTVHSHCNHDQNEHVEVQHIEDYELLVLKTQEYPGRGLTFIMSPHKVGDS